MPVSRLIVGVVILIIKRLLQIYNLNIPYLKSLAIVEKISIYSANPQFILTAVWRFVDDASDYDDDHYQANDRTCLLERQPSVAVSTQGQQAIEYLQNVDRDIKNILSSTMPQQLPTDDFVTRPPINRQTSITIRWKPLLSLIASLLIIPLIIFLFLFLNHTIGNINF